MSRNPHRIRRDRWGRDLDLGDLSGESLVWRLIMPWTDHFMVVVCVYLALFGIWEMVQQRWWWAIVDATFIVILVWALRTKQRNRRAWREQAYLFNAWEAVDGIDGEGS